MLRTQRFQGLLIRIENPRWSVRIGKDPVNGKPWKTEMQYDYGEIVGSKGMDGDPVDVFLGPNHGAKFAFVVHQLNPHTSELDEDKVFLGFDDSEQARRVYFAHYDEPEKFYGDVDAVPMEEFKRRVMKGDGKMIAAMSKLEIAAALRQEIRAQGPCGCTLKVGDPVKVDGLSGRGVVVARDGRNLVVWFSQKLYVKRDQRYVHKIASDYQSPYSSLTLRGIKGPMQFAEVKVESERGPLERPKRAYIVKQGTLFCLKSGMDNDQNYGCFPSREEAEAFLGYLK